MPAIERYADGRGNWSIRASQDLGQKSRELLLWTIGPWGSKAVSSREMFPDFWHRLNRGDDLAARLVFDRFTNRLVGLARANLAGRLARKLDPEDVVQSAYKSFFVRQRDGQFDVGGWDGLWALLTVITLRKCADRAEYYQAAKRNVVRESSETNDLLDQHPSIDREPQPEEAAMLSETVEAVFRAIDDPDERSILELTLEGLSTSEISEKLGRAERSVRRIREQTRKRIESMNA